MNTFRLWSNYGFTMVSLCSHYFSPCLHHFPFHVHYVFTTSSLRLHYVFTTSSLRLHYVFTTSSLRLHYVFTTSSTSSLRLHYVLTTVHYLLLRFDCGLSDTMLTHVCTTFAPRLHLRFLHHVSPLARFTMVSTAVPLWFHYGSTMVHYGSLWLHYGSTVSTMVPLWCHHGSTMVPLWFHYGSLWFHYGSTTVPLRFHYVPLKSSNIIATS